YDYRNGIRWYHFDPAKWLIWTMSKLGLAKGLKRVERFQIEERVLIGHKELLLEKIQSSITSHKEEWEKKINTVIESVLTKLNEVKKLTESYRELKKTKEAKKETLKALRQELKIQKKSLKAEYPKWMKLSRALRKNVEFT